MIVQIIILNAAHDPLRELGVRYDHRILAKIFHLFCGAFVLSFWPAISVVWFGVNMSGATFFAYWAFQGPNSSYDSFSYCVGMTYHLVRIPINTPYNTHHNTPLNSHYNTK